jgi:endonuclease/exonuclease/phosphatase family metal-dependent hydrolase
MLPAHVALVPAALLGASILAVQSAPPAPPARPKAPAAPEAPAAPKAPADGDGGESTGNGKGGGKGKAPRAAGIWFGVPKAPEKAKGAVRLAAYNVENLFDRVDDPALSGEFDDVKMATKDGRLLAIADAIRRLDADVLCIEEVEGLEALKWFRDTYLKDMGYAHAVSEDVGYYRGVEQAVLSRFPIRSHATYVQEDLSDMDGARTGSGWAARKPDQGEKFQRSPLRVDVDVDGWPLTVFVVHFKAGGKEFEYHRESEALQTVALVKDVLAKDPGANVAVLGDFNATPSMRTVKAMGEGGLRSAYDFRGVKRGDTRELYTTHDSGRAIDYIFMTPALAKAAKDGSFFVLGTVHPPSDYDWRKDPDKERAPEGYASDHYPVAIDLMPQRKAAPAKDAGAAGGAAK